MQAVQSALLPILYDGMLYYCFDLEGGGHIFNAEQHNVIQCSHMFGKTKESETLSRQLFPKSVRVSNFRKMDTYLYVVHT